MIVHLDDRALAAALGLLEKAKSSGILTVVAAEGLANVVLVEGRILYATANTVPPLEESLARKGIVSEDDLRAVMKLHQRKKVRQQLATVLLELGLVSHEQVADEVEEQIRSVLQEALSWTTGTISLDIVDMRQHTAAGHGCQLVRFLLSRINVLPPQRKSKAVAGAR